MNSAEYDLADSVFPELLTAEQVAELFEVDSSDVERWADEGILKRYRVANTVRFDVEDVKRLVRQRQDLVGKRE